MDFLIDLIHHAVGAALVGVSPLIFYGFMQIVDYLVCGKDE